MIVINAQPTKAFADTVYTDTRRVVPISLRRGVGRVCRAPILSTESVDICNTNDVNVFEVHVVVSTTPQEKRSAPVPIHAATATGRAQHTRVSRARCDGFESKRHVVPHTRVEVKYLRVRSVVP
jgi:hypothetical protein